MTLGLLLGGPAYLVLNPDKAFRRWIALHLRQVGKGEGSFLSLPVAARGSIPPIYRRALFGHRAAPWPVPRARRQVGSTAGEPERRTER